MATEYKRRCWTLRLSLLLIAGGLGQGVASAQAINTYFVPTGTGAGTVPLDPNRSLLPARNVPEGIHVGDFVIRPDVTESVGYNDNVEGFKGGRGSPFFTTNGSVFAISDWSRDSLFAAATVTDQRYTDLPGQDFTNWTIRLGGTLDLGRDKLGATYTHLDLSQTPGSIDAVTVAQPVSFQVDAAQLSYTVNAVGRFTFVPALDVTKYNFSDFSSGGQTVSQAYRDRVILQGGVTTRYELAPLRELLLVTTANHISYLNNTVGVPRRDSNGGTVLAGLDYPAPGANIRFRVLAGVQARIYVNSAYSRLIEPTVEASITWTPTRLTTLTLLGRRDIEDASDESIAGYTFTTARLTVDHELRRDVLLNGYVEAQLAEFQASKLNVVTPGLQEAGRTQVLYNFGASATWLINRNLRASATYGFSDRQDTQRGGSYLSNTGMLTLGFRL